MQQVRTVRLFLASSNELASERDHVELIVSRKNVATIKHGLFLEVVRWERLPHTAEGAPIQESFNSQISTCAAMIALFHSRVGPFTEEELTIALKRHKNGENPKHMYLCFKDSTIAMSKLADSKVTQGITDIQRLKKELRDAQLTIYKDFDSPEALELFLSNQLDLLIEVLGKESGPIVVSQEKVLNAAAQIPTGPSGTERVLTMAETRDLSEKVGLFREWRVNLHLTINAGDISFYYEQKMSAGRLEAQLRAKVLLLEEADRIGLKFSEPGDVSEHAKEIESRILDAWTSKTEGAAGT